MVRMAVESDPLMARYTGPKVRLSRRVGVPIADIPKHTGKELSLPGMHGFAPEDKHSFASFISSAPVDKPPEWVGDYFKNMKSRIDEVCP